jgi:hypothetical protein
MTLEDQIRAQYPWLPEALVQIYVDAFVETGDDALAWATVRSSEEYETYFPGNRREDGTLRYTEAQWAAIREDYRDTVASVGINPDLFESRYAELIAGNVDPREFAQRVDAITERVRFAGPGVLEEYSQMWGIDMTEEAVIASIFDPDLGQQILNKQITMAEITSAGGVRGFDVDFDLAASLFQADIDEDQARSIFGQAAEMLPVLSTLARRHADPDDDFNLEEFTSAAVFDDPTQRRRMRRLLAQERASFQQSGALGVVRDQSTGGQIGLMRR